MRRKAGVISKEHLLISGFVLVSRSFKTQTTAWKIHCSVSIFKSRTSTNRFSLPEFSQGVVPIRVLAPGLITFIIVGSSSNWQENFCRMLNFIVLGLGSRIWALRPLLECSRQFFCQKTILLEFLFLEPSWFITVVVQGREVLLAEREIDWSRFILVLKVENIWVVQKNVLFLARVILLSLLHTFFKSV